MHGCTSEYSNGRPPEFSRVDWLQRSWIAESSAMDSEIALYNWLQSDYQDEFPNLIDPDSLVCKIAYANRFVPVE